MKTIIFLFSLFFVSCEKSPMDQGKNDEPRIVWRKQLAPSLFDQISFDPVIFQNDLLFGYQTETSQGYYRFNKQNGDIVKRYDNINSFDYFSFIIDNMYFSTIGSKARIINLQTNQIETFNIRFESNASSVFASNFNNSLFLPDCGNKNYTVNYPLNEYKIIRSYKDNLKSWNVVWANKYEQEGDIFGTHIKYLVGEKNLNNEEVVIFPSQLVFNAANKRSKYKVEAVNITQNKLIWETSAFEVDSLDSGNLSNFPPQIFENIIICGISGSHLMAFDKNSGKVIWNQYFGDQISDSKIVIYNGKITIKDNSRNLYLIDARSGAILRKQSIIGGAGANWSLHKGLVYFTAASGKLYCVDANNLDIKWELKSPNKDKCSYCSFFLASPVVDPETNRLYISDRKEVICYQLPE